MSDTQAFTVDVVLDLLGRTIVSPFLCAFIPVVLAGHAKSWDPPAVYWSAAWALLLFAIASMSYVNRVYSAAGSWFFLPPRSKWDEQIVLVTGGGSGVGALLARTLALRNVTVVVMDLRAPVDPFEIDNVHIYLCDVSDYKQVQSCAEKIRKEVGDPTIIVNNAGTVKGKLLLDLTEEDVLSTYGANTLAHYWILKAFLPAMLLRGRGHIVSVASIMGIIGAAQLTDYCGSKSAVINLHQSLRFELDNRYRTPQIRTTLILPSYISTPLFSRARMPHTLSRLGAFFCPPVTPPQLVKALISALDADESRVIRLPAYSNLARITGVGVGVLPKWLIDVVQWASRGDWGMREYGPRPDAGERLIQEKEKRRSGQRGSQADSVGFNKAE